MMKVFFLSVVGLVAISSAADPKPCCQSQKFSGFMFQAGANTNGMDFKHEDNYFDIDIDYDRMMVRLVGQTVGDAPNTRYNVTIYQHYNTDKEYVVSAGHCYVNQLGRALLGPCLPNNATFSGSYQMGPGNNTFKVNVFTFMMGPSMMTHIHTMDSDCSPVAMTNFGMDATGKMNAVESFIYANVKQGTLSSSDPFTMPTMCMTPEVAVGK